MEKWLVSILERMGKFIREKIIGKIIGKKGKNLDVGEAINFYRGWSKRALAKELVAAKIIIENMRIKFHTGDPKKYLWLEDEKCTQSSPAKATNG